MIINTNMASLNAQRNLGISNNAIQKSLEKLSSGYRINRASDDAAGLAISEKMRGQIRGLNQAVKNAQNGISLIQTAEGALNETHSILQRMRELAVEASNGTNTSGAGGDRAKIQEELNALAKEVNRIANTTEFNTMKLFTGNFSGSGSELSFHIGANSGQTVSIELNSMDAFTLGIASDSTESATATSISGVSSDAESFITDVDNAIQQVSAQRSKLGAMQNRLEHTIANLNVASENLTSSESTIRDVDMAAEMSAFTKNQILSQAGVAMLAQANQNPQGILKLLG